MRCFTVLGPSQSGKTTLVRHLATLDDPHPVTEDAGLLSLTSFKFMGEPWTAIDVAGGPEIAAMTGGALMASDAAVICVPPDAEQAMLAAPWLRAVENAGVPAFIFINRIDNPSSRISEIVSALQEYSDHVITLRQVPIREGGKIVGAVDLISERAWKYREGQPSTLIEMPETVADRESEARTELLEHLSDFDDELLGELIEDREPAAGALYEIATREMQERVVLAALMGSAEHGNGMTRLMKALRHETPKVSALRERLDTGKAPLAVAFHAMNRKHVGKVVMLRALAEGVAVGAPVGGGNLGGLNALGGETLKQLAPGDIGLALKSDQLAAGRTVTASEVLAPPSSPDAHPPMLKRVVVPVHEKDEVRLSTALARLQETDPYLAIDSDPESGHAVVCAQGPMHMRHIEDALKDDFGIEVETSPLSGEWRETITKPTEIKYRHKKQSGGAGQFAEVVLKVRPRKRGEGFEFTESVKGGAVPRNYFPAVEAGVQEALQRGPLGFPVIDIGVELTDGKHHAVDSSDFAFRAAGRMAMRDALEQAGPVLLQGINRVKIHAPSVTSGSLGPMISSLKGQVLGFDRDPQHRGWDVYQALLPAAATDDLLQALAPATQGTAWIETEFDHYEELYGREAETVSKARLEALA